MIRRRGKSIPPHPFPWDRRPIGYELKPGSSGGWVAFLVCEGGDRGWLLIASGKRESAVRRRAEAKVRAELRRWEHKRSVPAKVILVD